MIKRILALSAAALVAAQDGALPPDQQVQDHGVPQHNPGEIKGDPAHQHHDPPPHDPAHAQMQGEHAVGEVDHLSGGWPLAPLDEQVERAQEQIDADNAQTWPKDIHHEHDPDLIHEWEDHMEGFIPETLVSFYLGAGKSEYFFHDVTESYTMLRGGFFSAHMNTEAHCDFQILDPEGKIVFHKQDKAEGLFHVYAENSGTYTIVMHNPSITTSSLVTFTFGTGAEVPATNDDLHSPEYSIKHIERQLKDIQNESTYLWIRQKAHLTQVQQIHSRAFWLSMAQFVVLMMMTACQIFYIKGLVGHGIRHRAAGGLFPM